MAGLVVVLLYLVALLAPLIAPFDPIVQGDLVRDSYMASRLPSTGSARTSSPGTC
jgi:hypothetical protein